MGGVAAADGARAVSGETLTTAPGGMAEPFRFRETKAYGKAVWSRELRHLSSGVDGINREPRSSGERNRGGGQ